METYAPVVIFAYKRLRHFVQLIESLNANDLVKQTDVYIYADYAKCEDELEDVLVVRSYIKRLCEDNQFKSLEVNLSHQHKGLANSVISGVSDVINKFGRVIVLEDDLYVSSDFLRYMNNALDYYSDIDNIWSIGGYTFPMKHLENYPYDIYYSYRVCSWGWATWKDRWDLVDWEVKAYQSFINDKTWIKKFNRGGKDLTDLLVAQMKGDIDSWAIRWGFAQSCNGMFTICPKVSRVLNKGCDGSGTHCGKSLEHNTIINNYNSECDFKVLSPDSKIVKEFYLKHTDTLKKKIKRNLEKIVKLKM